MNFFELSFGFFSLKIYGIGITLAFFVSGFHFYKRVINQKSDADFFVYHFWRWIVGALVVGRIVSLFLYPSLFAKYGLYAPLIFWEKDIHFWGACIGFFLIAFWDLKTHKLDPFQWFFSGLPSLLLGIMIVDIAAFLTGSIYGLPTILPWGVRYETFGVDILTPVHPISLYALLFHWWLYRWVLRKQKPYEYKPQKLCVFTGILFFGFDFFLQFLEADKTLMLLENFRIEQAFDLAIIFFLLYLHFRKK